MAIKDAPFFVNTIGETTGETLRGDFRALKFLSHRQQLLRDQKRRELLGPDGANASPRAQNQAEIFSQLFVRLTEAPGWWKDSAMGLDLADDNVALMVYEQALKIETDAAEAVKKAGEEARGVVKEELAKAA